MAVLPGVDPNQSMMGLEATFKDIAVSPPSLTMISGVTGRVIDADILMMENTGAHRSANLRNSVPAPPRSRNWV